MTEEDKKLIEAAKMIQAHCEKCEAGEPCCFAIGGKCDGVITNCRIGEGELFPSDWDIPEHSRWADADIDLAKALMAFGVDKIHKQSDSHAITFNCDKINYEYHCLPENSFLDMKPDEYVYLKDIVAEGENDG